MKYLLPALALIAACGGSYGPTSTEPTVYSGSDLPVEVHRRTLERSSTDGIFASEHRERRDHSYNVMVSPNALVLVAKLMPTTTTSSPTQHLLVDLLNTLPLDYPLKETPSDQLYRLLLLEHREDLDGDEEGAQKVAELTDFVLKSIEN